MDTTTPEGISYKEAKEISEAVEAVAEIQGLYGPFTFPEKLLQQIWARGDFDSAHAQTLDGQRIQIVRTGRWNMLGGPDFKGAKLKIGDRVVEGDVEVHLRSADWQAHQHARDAAYAKVILHVVLFSGKETTTRGVDGGSIPILAMLPLLHADLEQYAADAAVERLANRPQYDDACRELALMAQPALLAELGKQAIKRWNQKVHYAKVRIERAGWNAACHGVALEILGYSANRAAMISVSEMWPLQRWQDLASESVSPDAVQEFADHIYAELKTAERWSRQSVRPENHPRTRLRQYAAWVKGQANWPEVLARFSWDAGVPAGLSLKTWRKQAGLVALRERLAAEVCGNEIGGTRLDNLVCDGFLPFLAAAHPEKAETLAIYWQRWYVGDVPARFSRILRNLSVIDGRTVPSHHGATQGLLGWLLSSEKR